MQHAPPISRAMTEKAMDSSEVVDFADKHSGVMATSPQHLNPYKLGLWPGGHVLIADYYNYSTRMIW